MSGMFLFIMWCSFILLNASRQDLCHTANDLPMSKQFHFPRQIKTHTIRNKRKKRNSVCRYQTNKKKTLAETNSNNRNKGVHGTTFPISISTANLSLLHWLPYRANTLGFTSFRMFFLNIWSRLASHANLSYGDQGTYKLVNAIFFFSFHVSVKKSSKQLAWKRKMKLSRIVNYSALV